MKAITLYQPWASLVAVGAKKFETRGWGTSYRGQLAIHAGKKKPSDALCGVDIDTIMAMGLALGLIADGASVHVRDVVKLLDELPRGAIVCTTELAGSHLIRRNPYDGVVHYLDDTDAAVCIDGNEMFFGDWRPGRFAWDLKNVKKMPEPIPVRGMQGLWEWDEAGLL